jgi:hypothetical protein
MRSAASSSNIREHSDDAGTETSATKPKDSTIAQVCYAVLPTAREGKAEVTITKTLLIRTTTAMFLNDFFT